MSFPASGERFALAINFSGVDIAGTLLRSRSASSFSVNTDSPDALQLPIHFLGFLCAQDSKSLPTGGFEETILNTSPDASLASGGGHSGGKKDGQSTRVILLSFLSLPGPRGRGDQFGVEIKQFFQPLGVVPKTPTYIDALQNFVIAFMRLA